LGVGVKEQRFDIPVVPAVRIKVRLARDAVKELDWAAVLMAQEGRRLLPVCLYDNAHGKPERHRYRHGVKLGPETLSPRRSALLDLPAAISDMKPTGRVWWNNGSGSKGKLESDRTHLRSSDEGDRS
jgi:hypothetical protein